MDQPDFTQRQQEVIELLKQGKGNKQIALALGISERTVEDHLNHIYIALGVSSRTEAIIQLGKSTAEAGTNIVHAVESTIVNNDELLYRSVEKQATSKRNFPVWLIPLLLIVFLSFGALAVYKSNTKPWTYEREAEFPDRATVGQDVDRSNASGKQVHGQFGSLNIEPWSPKDGYVRYYNINVPKSGELYLKLRYSKFGQSSIKILVHLDEETSPREVIQPIDQGNWDNFTWTEWIPLGKISKGIHSIMFYTDGQEFGVADLDQFILTTDPPE